MTRAWCTALSNGFRLTIQVVPNAKKSVVVGVHDDALKIRLQAQPIEGKANEALIRYVADVLDLPKSAVVISHGHTSKKKILEVISGNLDVEGAMQIFLRLVTE
jgi:uncharacterized protein (TIGR00251 family)